VLQLGLLCVREGVEEGNSDVCCKERYDLLQGRGVEEGNIDVCCN